MRIQIGSEIVTEKVRGLSDGDEHDLEAGTLCFAVDSDYIKCDGVVLHKAYKVTLLGHFKAKCEDWGSPKHYSKFKVIP